MIYVLRYGLTFFLITLCVNTAFTQVLLKAHAHNDYTHKRPLYDALEQSFFSVEVDLFYRDGNFLVAHIKPGIRKKKTLRKLYLEPLKKIVNENGTVYQDGPLEFVMMIDLKGGWNEQQLDELQKEVEQYAELITVFKSGVKEPGAVTILLSAAGHFKEKLFNQEVRYFSIDGRLDDLGSGYDHKLIPRVSSNYKHVFKWRGKGVFPDHEKQRLQELVTQVHSENRKIRFWASPDKKSVWKELLDAGVDWINVDKLQKFRAFYLDYRQD